MKRKVSLRILGHRRGGHSPYKFPKVGYRTSTCLSSAVCILLSPLPNTPSPFPFDYSLCLWWKEENGTGLSSPFSFLGCPWTLKILLSWFLQKWICLLWLMPASPENSLRATLSCQNIAYQDVLLNIILSLRVWVYSSLINIKPTLPDDNWPLLRSYIFF